MVKYAQYVKMAIACAKTHGIRVAFVDSMPVSSRPTPVRGAFRMGEVFIAKDNPEEALFVLLHGLGHMAQWTLFPEEHERSYAYNAKSNSWDETSLRMIRDHEWSALPFVLGFLNVHRLEALHDWYVGYFIADQHYLVEIFRDNQYDLQKFHTSLSKVRSKSLQRVCNPIEFPDLDLESSREEYICLV